MKTYKKAGVDEDAEQSLTKDLLDMFRTTNEICEIGKMDDIGYFANTISLPETDFDLAVTTDGVGTKLLLAESKKEWIACGRDLVSNNVNDIVCVGARPLAFLDYMAVGKMDIEVLNAYAYGMFLEAASSKMLIPGGEIAQVPDLLHKSKGCSMELSGTCIGIVPFGKRQKQNYKTPRAVYGRYVSPSNVVIGLYSSGPHSNGYTLIRKTGVYKDKRVRELLMQPTINYSPVIDTLLKSFDIDGIVHISGGGLLNLLRLKSRNAMFVLTNMPEVPEVFSIIAKKGKVPVEEMYSTFNMGIGMCLVVPQEQAYAIVSELRSWNYDCHVIGHVEHTLHNDPTGSVMISGPNLVGRGNKFEHAGHR